MAQGMKLSNEPAFKVDEQILIHGEAQENGVEHIHSEAIPV